MAASSFALLAVDGIVVRTPLAVPPPVRALWSESAARLRDAVAAGAYRINAHAIAEELLARVVNGRRH